MVDQLLDRAPAGGPRQRIGRAIQCGAPFEIATAPTFSSELRIEARRTQLYRRVMPAAPLVDVDVDVDGRRLRQTNVDKVLYPETGTTKGDVIHYATIAPGLLPHLAERPVTRKRWPNGAGTEAPQLSPSSSRGLLRVEAFFEKDLGSGAMAASRSPFVGHLSGTAASSPHGRQDVFNRRCPRRSAAGESHRRKAPENATDVALEGKERSDAVRAQGAPATRVREPRRPSAASGTSVSISSMIG
jgi:hypothetical protein